MPIIVDADYLQSKFPDNEQNLILALNAREAMAHLAEAIQTVQDAVDVFGVNPGGGIDLTALVAQLNNLEVEVDANTAAVAVNVAAIADHEARVAALEAAIADHETRISTLEGQVATLLTDVSTAQSDIVTLRSDVDTNTAGVADHEARVTILEGTVAAFPGLGFTIFVSATEPVGAVDGDVWIQPAS